MTAGVVVDSDGYPTFKKVAAAVIDYAVDFTAYLNGDTLATKTVTAESGLTVDSSAISGDDIRAFVSGGTAGTTYSLYFGFTTAAGITDERTVKIAVVEHRGI